MLGDDCIKIILAMIIFEMKSVLNNYHLSQYSLSMSLKMPH